MTCNIEHLLSSSWPSVYVLWQGKINKHLAEICFVDQAFVKDDKVTVAKKLEEVSKAAGAKLSFKKVALYILGK